MTQSVVCAIVWYYLGNVDPILVYSRTVWQVIDIIDEFWPCRGPTIREKIKKYFWLGALLLQKYNTIIYDARGQNPPPP